MVCPPGLASHERLRASLPALFALALFAAWIGAGIGGETVTRYVDDLATFAAALAATAACVLAARRQTRELALFWWLLAAATGAWTLGELLWARYDLVSAGTAPVLTWADVGYLGALPLAAAALLVHPALRRPATGKVRAVLDGLALASALFFLSWTLVLGPLWHDTDLTTLGGVVTLAYPIGDVVVLLLVVLVIRGTSSRDRLDLWLLLLGLVAIACSDAVYGYLNEVRQYSTGNLVDVGWVAGYLAIALGARATRPLEEIAPERRAATSSPAASLVPFLPLLAALIFAAARMQLGRHLDRLGFATALALIVFVLLRQLLLMFDLVARGEEPKERLLSTAGGSARRQEWARRL